MDEASNEKTWNTTRTKFRKHNRNKKNQAKFFKSPEVAAPVKIIIQIISIINSNLGNPFYAPLQRAQRVYCFIDPDFFIQFFFLTGSQLQENNKKEFSNMFGKS